MEGTHRGAAECSTQPEFGTALAEAKAAVGLQVCFACHVEFADNLEIVEQKGRVKIRQKNGFA